MMNIFSPLQLVWARITFNRVTTIYTLNALTYCIVMVLCQVSLWNMNVYAGDLGKAIMAQTNLSASKFVYLEAHTGVLRLCQNNHDALTPDKSCSLVWDPKTSPFTNSTTLQFPTSTDPLPTSTDARSNKKRYVEIEKTVDSQGLVNGVRVAGLHLDQFATGAAHQAQHLKDTTIADLTCVQAIKWPIQIVLQGKREDVLLTAFQIWVLGMSLVAVLNESIPHIFGAYVAHVLAIIWSAFQIWETANFKSEYLKVTLNGACAASGLDFLTQYFDPRTKFGIAMAVINVIALFSSGFLTYKLFHLFGWSTFKRIGASVSINRVYKLALTLSIVIQMSLFFIVSMMGLWIDQIYSGVFAPFSARSGLYKVVFIILFVLLVPWLALGWFAVRKEQRWWMHIFILISVILLGAWGGIMFSTSFQLTFVHWRFFSAIWVVAFLLLLLTLVMGVVCRLNFGKGLAEYLQQQQQEDLSDEDAEKFRPDSPAPSSLDEKDLVVSFPSDSSNLPQFLPSQAAPAPLVPSKKSFYSKWGRSKAPHQTPPAPRGAPPAPPSNSTYDLERGPPSYMASSLDAVNSHGSSSYAASSANASSLNSLAVLHDHEAPFAATNSYRSTTQNLSHVGSTSALSQEGGVSIAHTLSLDNNTYSAARDSSVAHTLSPLPGTLSRDGTMASSTMFSHHGMEMYGSPPQGSALDSSGISHRDRDTTHSRMSGASGIIATAGLARSDTSFTGFTAHRKKGSAGTIGSFNSALDPTMPAVAHAKAGISVMPSALMRTDTLRSVDSVRTIDTMDSGRTVGAGGGKGVTRNTSTTSTASMKPGVKPKNWTIE